MRAPLTPTTGTGSSAGGGSAATTGTNITWQHPREVKLGAAHHKLYDWHLVYVGMMFCSIAAHAQAWNSEIDWAA